MRASNMHPARDLEDDHQTDRLRIETVSDRLLLLVVATSADGWPPSSQPDIPTARPCRDSGPMCH